MTKRLTHELTYDGATVEQVADMLADKAFREKVCLAQGVTKVKVTADQDGDELHVVLDQWRPTQGMPSVAKKFVGEETNIVQDERWSGRVHGDITVTIPGKPGDMKGTAVLSERAGGAVETVDLTIKVNIPLVGGKLEQLISDLLLSALKVENKEGKKYLAAK